MHIDASLIRANVSWESLVGRHVEDVLNENRTAEEIEVERKGRQSGKYKKVCTTDPDATMATNARNRRLEPAYKQHTAVDDKVGVVLDVAVTTGQTNEGEMIEPQVDEIEATTGVNIKTVTADAGYALSKRRVNKAAVVGDDYPALLRARRRRERWSEEDRRLYQRHRWRSEGFHGEAKTWHGLARAVRRGLANMKMQSYLTAAAINLKRLAAALLALLLCWIVPGNTFATRPAAC